MLKAVDWAGWTLFGLVATTALTAVMIAAQLTGLTRLGRTRPPGHLPWTPRGNRDRLTQTVSW